MGPVRRKISPHARRLRRDRTEAEDRFWFRVRDRRLGGFKFRFQHSIEPFVGDFACLEARVIVEIDGSQHTPEVDALRQAFIERHGFKVLRFWNNDIMQRLDAVLDLVLAICEARTTRFPFPSPAVAGEGGRAEGEVG